MAATKSYSVSPGPSSRRLVTGTIRVPERRIALQLPGESFRGTHIPPAGESARSSEAALLPRERQARGFLSLHRGGGGPAALPPSLISSPDLLPH